MSWVPNTLMAFSRVSGGMETRYSFDESARLAGVRIPLFSNTARLDALKYSYDELGNRRRVYLDTTNQSGVRTVIDDWYKYDQEGRVLVESGFLKNGQVVAGKVNNKGKGTVITYSADGRRKTSEQWDKTSGSTEIFQLSEYSYSDAGQVTGSSARQIVRGVGADNTQTMQSISESILVFDKAFDSRGRQLSQVDYVAGVASGTAVYSYRGDGQLINQTSYAISNGVQRLTQQNYFGETGMIDAVGNQLSYRYVVYNQNGISVKFINYYKKRLCRF